MVILVRRDHVPGVLLMFLLAMVLHPEVYAAAQQEIDRVIGSTRLPELSDRDDLPFMNAVIKETYRYTARLVNSRSRMADIYTLGGTSLFP